MLKYQELKEHTGKLIMVDSEIYEEVLIEAEMDDDKNEDEDHVKDMEMA